MGKRTIQHNNEKVIYCYIQMNRIVKSINETYLLSYDINMEITIQCKYKPNTDQFKYF